MDIIPAKFCVIIQNRKDMSKALLIDCKEKSAKEIAQAEIEKYWSWQRKTQIVDCIFGTVQIFNTLYLIAVTDSSLAAQIGDQSIYRALKFEFIVLPNEFSFGSLTQYYTSSNEKEMLLRIKQTFNEGFLYYSSDMDITKCL